ncbi:MAG: hypothetical protein J0M24_23820 [Verrucomicrobia bacterium]|nr:hypothetical protein [Verrucomicrobiota bacterium]
MGRTRKYWISAVGLSLLAAGPGRAEEAYAGGVAGSGGIPVRVPAGGPPPTLVRVQSEYVAPSSLGSGGAEASFYQVGAQAQMPFPLIGKLSGNIGLGLENRGYDFKDFSQFLPGVSSPMDQVIAARIGPGLTYQIDDKWRLLAGASWLYAGAVGSSASEAGMWGGLLGALYQWSPSLTLVGGVAVTERLDSSVLVVPILGFNWRIDDRWAVVGGDVANAIDGPTIGAQVSYRLDSRWMLFGLGGYVGTYTRFADDSSLPNGSLRYRSAAALAGAEFSLTPTWVLRLSAGARLAQQYTFRGSDGNDVAEDDTGASPTVSLTVRAAF